MGFTKIHLECNHIVPLGLADQHTEVMTGSSSPYLLPFMRAYTLDHLHARLAVWRKCFCYMADKTSREHYADTSTERCHYGAWMLDVWFDKIPAENAALPSHSGTSRDPNLMDGLLLISGS